VILALLNKEFNYVNINQGTLFIS